MQEINCAYPDDYLYDIQKALTCFKGENSFEAIVKKATMLEEKSDSVIAIVGSLAEAYYGIRSRLKLVGKNIILKDIQSILDKI